MTDRYDGFAPVASEEAIKRAAETFRTRHAARLENVLLPESADALTISLGNQAPWSRTLNQGDKVWDLDTHTMGELGADRLAALLEAVHTQARDGFQFMYDSLRVSENPEERHKRALPVDCLLDALNSDVWLEVFRTLTEEPAIRLVDGQATRYLPGHFLTAHDDNVPGKNRVAAYILSLTPGWRTEWGGLLQFHDAGGDISHALCPRFNALHLLRVPQRHSVSYVAPFAGHARISITGWLRT
ncbi:2OG-Fe(II) oxygenase [Novosphingobium cyanobacteriorum]|uniref:2OG-Fe(II) oxygenase family protein n=1 Tax=Novosphingobium cyanobacteriorum TaxID=3024215 RepID=A0ABT6CLN8_9SPHN|nr:2OG-Fe(II) oxygenase family protein [Novosphingobium cyanobacteriorum]MDF8334767.1 2OG-Fe(II) oxygenase family protein [Novosphingobium cyanobacteriorum]